MGILSPYKSVYNFDHSDNIKTDISVIAYPKFITIKELIVAESLSANERFLLYSANSVDSYSELQLQNVNDKYDSSIQAITTLMMFEGTRPTNTEDR